MKIPAAFRLMGHRITVRIIEEADWPDDDIVGVYSPSTSEILLLRRASAIMEQTFLHELLHAIFKLLGRHKADADEVFIDTVAGLLHQALTSQED